MRPDQALQLDQLSNIFLDMSNAQPMIYLVNGQSIIRASLPDEPRPLHISTNEPVEAEKP
ncbi:MAG: hypothetical protein HC837_01245 [Chloroflexaceae bacterium]|nr:hypothetical protein [Chloroflexaceae bacterium]